MLYKVIRETSLKEDREGAMDMKITPGRRTTSAKALRWYRASVWSRNSWKSSMSGTQQVGEEVRELRSRSHIAGYRSY